MRPPCTNQIEVVPSAWFHNDETGDEPTIWRRASEPQLMCNVSDRCLFCKLRFGGCLLHSRTSKELSNTEAKPDPSLAFSLTSQGSSVSSTGLNLLCFINSEALTWVTCLKYDLHIKRKKKKSSRENIGEYLLDLAVRKVFINRKDW